MWESLLPASAMHPRLAFFYNSLQVNSHWFTEVMFIGRSRYEKIMGHWDWLHQRLSRSDYGYNSTSGSRKIVGHFSHPVETIVSQNKCATDGAGYEQGQLRGSQKVLFTQGLVLPSPFVKGQKLPGDLFFNQCSFVRDYWGCILFPGNCDPAGPD